jgi:hypothetical protein
MNTGTPNDTPSTSVIVRVGNHLEDLDPMTQLLRRFRGLAIALAVLAISAGAVFAGAPRFIPNGAPVANQDPVETPDEDVDGDEDLDGGEDVDEGLDEDLDEDLGEGDEDLDGETETGTPDGNHGAVVSVAAQLPTPDGFENHGAFVSCVARYMKDTEEPVDPATVTIETCLAAQEAAALEKAAKHEAKAAERAERKAARDAAKAEKSVARDAAKAERAAARAAAKAARAAARG